jgi:hypothetical protein
MDGRSLFGVIVRAVGLGFAVFQVYQLFEIGRALSGGAVPMTSAVAAVVMMPVLWLVIGVLIMRRADLIVNFAYPQPKEAPKPAANGRSSRTKA